MPLVDLTVPRGALDPSSAAALLRELMTILLRWEGAPPNSDVVRRISWSYLHEVDHVLVGGSSPPRPPYRIDVTVPAGILDRRAKAGVVRDMTAAVVGAERSDDPHAAFRVWCLIHDVPDGNWGADGRIYRRADSVRLVDTPASRVTERAQARRWGAATQFSDRPV